MKHIIALFFTAVIIGLMVWTASKGGAYNGGEHAKVIKDIATLSKQKKSFDVSSNDSIDEQEQKALEALRKKAGNVGSFKVSTEYKSRCSSCHGIDGTGMQNGRKLMGPKLFGQSSEEIYRKLLDFKTGRKENLIMKGLLLHMSKEDLRRFADEIGEFPSRAKAAK